VTHGAPAVCAPAPLHLVRRGLIRPPTRGTTRHARLWSDALDRELDYWLYLPPNYRSERDRRYPVLYMLHGLYGNSAAWKDHGLFNHADNLIRSQQIAPLIIVAPQGDNGYWMNHADGGPRWADYVVSDLVPHIDRTYRTLPESRHRAIGGLSMGGHGAIQLALNHPGVWGAVGGHSAVFRSAEQAFPFFGAGESYQRRDPVSLVGDLGVPVTFALWLDMGADDSWAPRTIAFHELLEARGVSHAWMIESGGHDGSYWATHVPAYLRWYDQQIRPDELPAQSAGADADRLP
jgi:enterochelin esterase-like enzyme